MTWRAFNMLEIGDFVYFDFTNAKRAPGTNAPCHMLRLALDALEWRALYWDGNKFEDANKYTTKFLAALSEEQKAEALAAAIIHSNRGT